MIDRHNLIDELKFHAINSSQFRDFFHNDKNPEKTFGKVTKCRKIPQLCQTVFRRESKCGSVITSSICTCSRAAPLITKQSKPPAAPDNSDNTGLTL